MKPENKREILIAREGFIQCYLHNVQPDRIWAERKANEMYPLPKITRPRERTDEYGERWRVVNNKLENWLRGEWNCLFFGDKQYIITSPRAAIFHDLFQNPTEEVEDETP